MQITKTTAFAVLAWLSIAVWVIIYLTGWLTGILFIIFEAIVASLFKIKIK